jgi:hypothetical protein
MKFKNLPIIVLLVLGLPMAACAPAPAEEVPPETAVTVVPIEGTDLGAVILTARSAERLGIQTARVGTGQAGGTVVPYAAVLYDELGETWVFTNPEGLEYARAQIVVDDIAGDDAHLSSGPPVGTKVVIVGVAELFGAEKGVGDPE